MCVCGRVWADCRLWGGQCGEGDGLRRQGRSCRTDRRHRGRPGSAWGSLVSHARQKVLGGCRSGHPGAGQEEGPMCLGGDWGTGGRGAASRAPWGWGAESPGPVSRLMQRLLCPMGWASLGPLGSDWPPGTAGGTRRGTQLRRQRRGRPHNSPSR